MSMMRRRLLDDTVRRTAEGEAIAVRSVARMRPGLSIYGKSHQNTVAGNQLLDTVNAVNQNFTITGVTVTNNGDGSFTVIGTPTITEGAVFTYYITEALVLENGQYALSSGIACRIDKKDGTAQDVATSFTFNSEVDEFANIYWQRDTNNYVDGEIIWPMLNIGTTALPWEPYTGGQPSPNPDYPQEIESVGDDGNIGVDVYGGNLFNSRVIPESETNGVTSKIMPDGGIQLVGETGEGQYAVFSKRLSKEEYSLLTGLLTASISTNSTGILLLVRFRRNGVKVAELIPYKDHDVTYNIDGIDYDEIQMGVQVDPNTTVDEIVYPMLNIGSTALPFEPYKQPQSLIVSTPDGLPGIPVSSGGNYTDESGQQWISDEIDFKRGKYVQRVRILNAREALWTGYWNNVFPDESENTHVFNTSVPNKFKSQNAFCTHFRFGDFVNPDNGYNLFSTKKGGGDIGVRVSSELASTIEEWNQFIQQNDVVFACALQNPIETDLTPEQITAYQSLHTNYPTTTVMNDEGAGMKLTYKTRKSLEVT